MLVPMLQRLCRAARGLVISEQPHSFLLLLRMQPDQVFDRFVLVRLLPTAGLPMCLESIEAASDGPTNRLLENHFLTILCKPVIIGDSYENFDFV